jgi:hypothetical protein
MHIQFERPHTSIRPIYLLIAIVCLALGVGCGDSDEEVTEEPTEEPARPDKRGCTDPRASNYDPDATIDNGSCQAVTSSPYFLDYAKPANIPGKFPDSSCTAITTHHQCVEAVGCGWLRTIMDNGVCRPDPVSRCLDSGECIYA